MTTPSKRIEALLDGLERSPGASVDDIDAVEKKLGAAFPSDYRAFLQRSNGAAGEIEGSYVEFWPAEQLVEANEDYHVEEFVPGLVLVGSDGAGNAYAFDARPDASSTWLRGPVVTMEFKSAEPIGETFEESLEAIAAQDD